MRRAVKNTSQADKLAAALDAATNFEGEKQLGHLLLLPTEIRSQILIRFQGSLISIVCVLHPADRFIHINDSNKDVENNLLPISTPRLVLQFDVSFNHTSNLVSSPVGYLYEYHPADTLTEALKIVKHFFFPHIYHKAYMCINTGKRFSPRALSTSFWSSNFTSDWHGLFYGGGHWGTEYLGAGSKLIEARDSSKYQEHQTSTGPLLDEQNRKFLQGYTDHFELAEKPLGVFISNDPKVLEAAGNTCIQATNKKIAVGFAFLRDQEYWIWLKNGQFLHIKPEQVKVL